MSLENEDQNLLDQPTNHELHKNRKLKFSYSREFLLSLSELDTCKELPTGFDRSLLSEFEDALVDRHRSTGGLSTTSFRRNEYSSSPPARGDTNSFLRGTHGKWDTRSSGRSDKYSDSQSERESDSGKHFSNQTSRSWQGPGHDGLLGSGSLPRPPGYEPGPSAPKFRANANYQLNRANDPYQRSGPYKAPHSRRDTHDNYNDETFGSSAECADEDKAEEERKRRASFELMRKEQQKAFQEKQKLNPHKNKDIFDITSLLDDNDKRLGKRSNESVEPPVVLSALSDDSEKSSLAHIASTSRPLVPPGFASTLLERNLGVKTSTKNCAMEVGQSEPVITSGNRIVSEYNEGNLSTKQADDDQLHHRSKSLNFPIKNEKGNISNISSAVDILDISIENSDQLRKRSTLSETLETSHASEFIQPNAAVKRTEAIGAFNQDDSHSILNKLFVNALSLKSGNTGVVVEHNDKADETWNPHAFQSSKFAHWFVEEEKNPLDDFTHRPNDLLSLIVGGEKGGLQVSDMEKTQHIALASPFQNAEPAYEHLTSNVVHTPIDRSEQLYKSDKAELAPTVLTCEDLEQSILSQVNENGVSLEQPMQDKDSSAKTLQSNSNSDNHASQHLLSLLHKGTCHKNIEQFSIVDVDSSDKVCNTQGAATASIHDDPVDANADFSNSSKQLTLETLFGTAFMKELQTVGEPLSVQRSSVESEGSDVSDSIMSLFPASDIGLSHAGGHALNRHGSGILPSEKTHPPQPNRFGEQWLEYGDPQGDVNSLHLKSKFSKASGFDGRNDIHFPEEDSFIAVGDPLQNFLSAGNSAKSGLSYDIAVDNIGKLAALNPALRVEQPIMGNQGLPHSRGPYDMRESGIPYQNLNVQRSSRLQPPQLNQMGPMFNQLDSNPPHISPYIKLMTSEGMVHRESPSNHQFPGNMHLPPFDQPSNAINGFGPPAHHSILQQMHMQGNHPPPNLLSGFPGRVPLPAHPSNPMTGFIQEPNQMQGFPFNGHRQPPFGGPGMPLQASDVAGGRNHPEILQRLFEMEHRSRDGF
ncbi:PREDICTED: uncharacterized protein LOC109356569 [Lupinus angustifolius]|uniref:uncharacterized protein LOC109356569 n=1 Tax=Lupinus angustifolius TaxID=3871 RepID=UPI00092EC280|nr:PREDICTED: uncharacterized protein LOC109356569 [Lupinus angustifolius]XP_019455498.1 PREDICTED: uncharacterized protein LOC109356569 [Lupinus angustifolius]XP_019455499.1 PREDICTED: uncharacterized protein LOC109356569 [Lupinus angustifolius]